MAGRWGSFLQQAVAGVEARLDNILAEEPPTSPAAEASSRNGTAPPPRQPSSQSNSKLQGRLAKAVANKSSLDAAHEPESTSPKTISHAIPDDRSSQEYKPPLGEMAKVQPFPAREQSPATTPPDTGPSRSSLHTRAETKADTAPSEWMGTSTTESDCFELLSRTETDERTHQTWGADRKAEQPERRHPPTNDGNESEFKPRDSAQGDKTVQSYIELVDALESKLQFLAHEATESARKSAAQASPGSVHKLLSEKDEKIALLMSEGQTLTSTEQKHRRLIKKLRLKAVDDDEAIAGLYQKEEQMTSELRTVRHAAEQAHGLEATKVKLQQQVEELQKEVDGLRIQVKDGDTTVTSLRVELETLRDTTQNTPHLSGDSKEQKEELSRRIVELEETADSLRLEKHLAANRAQLRAKNLESKIDATREKELQVKSELELMEGKLEAMRVVAEEASSTVVGDSQAKLLRQIETLQSQYAIAKENWHGIESSLVSRISVLEQECNEALQRELDMRKKAKESSSRYRNQGEELQELRDQFVQWQAQANETRAEMTSLKRLLAAAERDRAQLQEQADRQNPSEKEKAEQAATDGLPILGGGTDPGFAAPIPGLRNQARPLSPLSILGRGYSSDSISPTPSRLRIPSTPHSAGDTATDKGCGPRRQSGYNRHAPPIGFATMPSSSTFDSPLEVLTSPTSLGAVKDEASESNDGASTPQLAAHDVVSVSTAGAGPSIQLVERMSAAVRRLEGERITTKEELARISSQRDEARTEVVNLIKKLEETVSATQQMSELKQEKTDINARYQTTLEMLGEKSELVEELRADIQDVKAMYRDLVERTVR